VTTASDLPTRAAATTSGPGPQPQQPPTAALRTRFPSRPVATTWPQTRCSRQLVLRRLLAEPFVADTVTGEENRRRGLRIVLDWLEAQPGDTWQQRWLASDADGNGRTDWRSFPVRWRKASTPWECRSDAMVLGSGLLPLMCADVIRPGVSWLLTTATPKRLAAEMARTRDPAGFADLRAHCDADPVRESTTRLALHRIAALTAAKGGVVADITVGDCLELLGIATEVCDVPIAGAPTSTS
jgi:hypothetical protein